MTPRNAWMATRDHFAGWVATLPAPLGDPEPAIRFAIGIVEAGERHAVYLPVGSPSARPYQRGAVGYEAYLRAQVAELGQIAMFSSDLEACLVLTPALLAFFRGDAIVEERIADVGALASELHGLSDGNRACMRAAAPLDISGDFLPIVSAREVRVLITTSTDIWFPTVTGVIVDVPDDEDKPDTFDNRELARRHTPRLNAFLATVRDLAVAAGGRWEPAELSPMPPCYAWTADGILGQW